jgi:hypothetical protein
MSTSLLLAQALETAVTTWRATAYHQADYSAIGEVLRWAQAPTTAFQLRPPQLLALETYWYLRLVLASPRVGDLYMQLFPEEEEWAHALALPPAAWQAVRASREHFLTMLRENESFVRQHRLESVRESLTLAYPSYIFALAMGVGKTALIGALVASEFALALAHPSGPFLRNALVFAPGRTIIESLRELIDLPYAAILPPHLHKPFAAAVKFVVPQDGAQTIPVLPGSAFNVIITNTEKIRIQQEKVRKSQLGPHISAAQFAAAKAEVANLRLQTIAGLPALGIFSDEAHHTYGRALGVGLKKVRKTVDYLAAATNVRCVVNTTGTPYFGRQPLRDVVIWYGLAAGIRDGILKEVGDNVITYGQVTRKTRGQGDRTPSTPEAAPLATILRDILRDFFATYGGVSLPDGTPAKLAIYFPKTADIQAQRPVLETTLLELGLPPTLLLEHHTRHENKADFDRFRSRQSPYRVALLVDRGVEGWDVPALFACALVRKLKTSNNFVLQAASRCLRQTPGNTTPARIYLSAENGAILARQLRMTYGDALADITAATHRARVKPAPPQEAPAAIAKPLPIQLWQMPTTLRLTIPKSSGPTVLRAQRSLWPTGADATTVALADATPAELLDAYTAAYELAIIYHLDLWLVYTALRHSYRVAAIPVAHLPALRRQIEEQCQPREGKRD